MEDKDTLLAYPGNGADIYLRFSSISISKGNDNNQVAIDAVRERGKDLGIAVKESIDKAIIAYDEETEENGIKLIIKYWQVGSKNTLVFASASIRKGTENKNVVKKLLDRMPEILESVEVTKVFSVVKYDDKKVAMLSEEVDPESETILEFSENDMQWLESSLRSAQEMGVKYGSGGELNPAELDNIFSRWLSEEREKESNDYVSNALGASFGEFLSREHNFRWIVIVSKYGSEYAVRHKAEDITSYPRASVQKRIETKQEKFFEGIYSIILDRLRQAGAL